LRQAQKLKIILLLKKQQEQTKAKPPILIIPHDNIQEGGGNLPIEVPYGAAEEPALTTRNYHKDKNWPYDQDRKDDLAMQGKVQYGTQDAIKQHNDDKSKTDNQIWLQRKESKGDIEEAGTGKEDQVFSSLRDKEQRTKQWASHDFTKDVSDQDFEDDNYKNKINNIQKEYKRMDKTQKRILEKILKTAISKYIAESVCKNIMEKTPPGKTPGGKSYEDVVKGVKKSGSASNPWAVAWDMKNKSEKNKSESKLPKSSEELQEAVDNYFKEMGYEKEKKEGCSVYKKKPAAKK